MTVVLALLAYLALPVIGWGVAVRREPPGVRIAVATAAGGLIVGIVMSAMSVLHIEWSRTVLLPVLALIAIALNRWSAGRPRPAADGRGGRRYTWLVPWLFTVYGTITARESCGDLQFTWGPKAIQFFRAGGLDPKVLHAYPQLTVDYPPLQTLLFAWSNTLSHQFSWWGAVLLGPLLFLLSIIVVREWSGNDHATLLYSATMAWGYALAYPSGCAEPLLLLYETLAIVALTFLDDDPRAQTFYAALGLAGAAFTKLEGSTFVIAVFLAIVIIQRNAKRALIVIVPAAILVGAWMTFVFRNDLLYMYGGARMPMYFSALPVVLKTLAKVAKFDLYWLPWLVPIVLVALGNVRRAAVPLAIALLTSCATIYFYLHYPDPTWWIESSSPRVILTPLLALLIAAAAAWRERTELK
ncbi:MAG TPA: hypothetical protein VJZ00_07755 [Thermoanaerobaculia bacterium]|nr:hypothetical protein [Thermoanaerobaculia bacterium]